VARKLSNGNYRGRVRDPRTDPTLKARDEARRKARAILAEPNAHLTVHDWWHTWTTSAVYGKARGRSPETVAHNRERTRAFVARYGDQPLRRIDRAVALEWLEDGSRVWTVPALRAMFNDAERAGKMTGAPFNRLGLKTRSRVSRQLPSRAQIDQMLAAAETLTPPSFAAYLTTLCWQGIRPGEGDALRWTYLDLDADPQTMFVQQQWSAQGRRFKEPKHGSIRRLPLVPAVRDRLLRPGVTPARRTSSRRSGAATTRPRRASITGRGSAAPSGSATPSFTS
jgi:hypothetical protein